jgi:cell division protein FtsB
MNVDTGIWDKLTKMVTFLLIVAVCVGVGFWYLPLIQQNERMRQEIERLQAHIKQEEELSKQHRSAISSLQNDLRALERAAREKLGYARTNESVIRFEPAATNGPGILR